jgi:hypothetical protein
MDEAFRQLDSQLAPLPQSLRENGATIAELIPEAQGFRQQSLELGQRIRSLESTRLAAVSAIEAYRTTTTGFETMAANTTADLERSEFIAKAMLVAGCLMALITMAGFVTLGRALSGWEKERP